MAKKRVVTENYHPTLREFLKDNKKYSLNTIESYGTTVHLLLTFVDKDIGNIEGSDIEQWIRYQRRKAITRITVHAVLINESLPLTLSSSIVLKRT